MNVTVVICAYTLERWDAARARPSRRARRRPAARRGRRRHRPQRRAARAGVEGVHRRARVIANRSTKGLSGARNTGVAATTRRRRRVPRRRRARGAVTGSRGCARRSRTPTSRASAGGSCPSGTASPAPWFPETYYWILGCSYAGLPETGATLRNPIGANMALRRERLRRGRRLHVRHRPDRQGAARLRGDRAVHPLHRDAPRRAVRARPTTRSCTTLVPPSRLKLALLPVALLGRGTLQGGGLLARRFAGTDSPRSVATCSSAMPSELGRSLRSLPRHPRGRLHAKIALIVVGAAHRCGRARARAPRACVASPLQPGGDELGR